MLFLASRLFGLVENLRERLPLALPLALPHACLLLHWLSHLLPRRPLCASFWSEGLWSRKPVQCASGDYLPGDYQGWRRWRDSLPSVAHI